MQRVVVQCDVLIVGGGIAGCMAAIKASEHRSNVVLIEKANTRSSGGAWGGIDDIPVYVPEFHRSRGYAIDNLLQEHCEAVGGLLNKRVQRLILEQSYDRLLDWERFGIKIRDSQGQLRMVKKEEKNLPVWVAVEGRTIKPILTKEMRKRGCKILNRVMAIDILVKANRVAGAVGVSTREEKVFVFLAKSVILATGMTSFIYRNSSGVLYNTIYPNQTGDGRAMAYRAGVELVGMEFKFVRSGPVPLQRGARGASFVGGFFVDRYGNKLDGDPSYDPAKISEMKRNGRGPIFLDCSECTESDLGLTRENLMNEGAAALVQLWDKEGVD
ncbi:MAG: FAD-dependent oxidoreductase, partial [Nitrososphaerota archaeon]|nr:FAD-dependent oxidoreductase [Nitrososphaerota archaeon]